MRRAAPTSAEATFSIGTGGLTELGRIRTALSNLSNRGNTTATTSPASKSQGEGSIHLRIPSSREFNTPNPG